MFKIDFKNKFWDSTEKLILLLVFMFLPLAVNIIISVIPADDKLLAVSEKLIPGEMLAYCLSLIAPLFLLFLKTHGEGYKFPWLSIVFILSILVYFLALILTLVAKNSWAPGIDMNSGHRDLYFWLSITSVGIAIFLRFYAVHQDSRFSDYSKTREKDQEDFNNKLKKMLG